MQLVGMLLNLLFMFLLQLFELRFLRQFQLMVLLHQLLHILHMIFVILLEVFDFLLEGVNINLQLLLYGYMLPNVRLVLLQLLLVFLVLHVRVQGTEFLMRIVKHSPPKYVVSRADDRLWFIGSTRQLFGRLSLFVGLLRVVRLAIPISRCCISAAILENHSIQCTLGQRSRHALRLLTSFLFVPDKQFVLLQFVTIDGFEIHRIANFKYLLGLARYFTVGCPRVTDLNILLSVCDIDHVSI